MPGKEYIQMFGKSREEMVSETEAELKDAIQSKDKDRIKTIFEKLKRVFVGDDVFWANECASNMFVAMIMIVLVIILILTVFLAKAGIYDDFEMSRLIPLVVLCVVQLLIAIILTFALHGENKWLKFIDMVIVSTTIATATLIFGYRATMLLTLPVILSIKYLSEKLTKNVSILCFIFMIISTIASPYLGFGVDLNTVAYVPGTQVTITTTLTEALSGCEISLHDYMFNLIEHSLLPNSFQYILICCICYTIAKWCHRAILEQARVASEISRVDTELNMAKEIQANVLPRIFPPFPDRKEFDLFALMNPAKEVGGDFYDFFMVDEDHLAMVMADVSGKGVPAALFMMIGKAFIKNKAQSGIKPSEVFNSVNNELCENNELELFITAWLGILEISTGHVVACNAGHEYPIIRRAGEDFQLFKDKHGFVLAGMEDYPYRDYEFDLKPGDGFFVYTDGIPEATNSKSEMFGISQLLEVLNQNKDETPETTIANVREAINVFMGNASQFDDITMLELIYMGDRNENNQN